MVASRAVAGMGLFAGMIHLLHSDGVELHGLLTTGPIASDGAGMFGDFGKFGMLEKLEMLEKFEMVEKFGTFEKFGTNERCEGPVVVEICLLHNLAFSNDWVQRHIHSSAPVLLLDVVDKILRQVVRLHFHGETIAHTLVGIVVELVVEMLFGTVVEVVVGMVVGVVVGRN